MDQDKPFSGHESLALIESMINKAKNQFSENGHLYLIWGWVILICSIAQFVMLTLRYDKHYLVWFITWIGVIYQAVYITRKKRQRTVRTYTDEIIGFVWLSFFITIMLFAFIIARGRGLEYYTMIYPGFIALYGIPTFLSGTILRFKPLIAGGICCWILSVLATFTSFQYQTLLIGAAMIVAWIIPGYLLKWRFTKQMQEYARKGTQ